MCFCYNSLSKLTRLEVCELVGSADDEGARDGTEQIKSLLEIPLWGSIACLESIKLEVNAREPCHVVL